jgi:hypothetical protein
MRQQRPPGEPESTWPLEKRSKESSTREDEDTYGRRVPIQEQMQSHMLVLWRYWGVSAFPDGARARRVTTAMVWVPAAVRLFLVAAGPARRRFSRTLHVH